MREIIKSVSKLSIPTAISLASAVIKNKILALAVGPIGLGIYSQIVNLSVLLTSILPVGSLGLITHISSYHHDSRSKEVNFLLMYFFKRNFVIAVAFTLFVLLFHNKIGDLIFANSSFGKLLVLFSFFIPLNLILNFIDIYFKGIRQINKYVLFLSLNSILSTIITVPLIFYLGIEGAVLALVISVVLSIVNGLVILKKRRLLPDLKDGRLMDKSAIRNIYKLGLGSMVTLIGQQVTILAIKSITAASLGMDSVGLFQCIFSISTSYFGIFFSLVGTHSIPKVSTIRSNQEIVNELNNTIKFLFLLYIPIIISMFICRTLVISILYSSEFLDARNLFIFQLPAELLRGMGWILALWLIPNLKVKEWIMFDSTFYLLFFSLFYILLQYFKLGLESVCISYLVAYLVYVLINLVFAMHSIKFRFTNYNLKLLGSAMGLISLTYIISYYKESYGFIALLPILTFWMLIVFRRDDFVKLKNLLLLKGPDQV